MNRKIPDHIDGLIKYIAQTEEKANEDLILKYFRKIYGNKFTRQKEAKNSDGYVSGHFVLELKGISKDWLSGLFQGVAYQRELDFSLVVVAAKHFLAVWKVEDIDELIREEILISKAAPNAIGKIIAKKYKSRQAGLLKKAIWNLRGELTGGIFPLDATNIIKEVKSFESTLNKQKRVRRRITTKNFTSTLKEMVSYFDETNPIKTVRAFYSMVFGWTEDSRLEISQKNKTQAALKGEIIDHLIPGKRMKFKFFVENHFISLGPGENIDDFFAKYDKALDAVDPNFRRKHGIFFTDLDLSKFVMWFVKSYKKDLGDIGKNYLVIDPACGSGNLVTNWCSPLEIRHKVVSEIEPELLYTVEQRMKGDAWHNGKYTVVPKVEENKGLNFLDKSAIEYIEILKDYLSKKGHKPDKPLAFLCNPPYRSDDDQKADSIKYEVHPSILELTKNDASAERYCCFLAQMKLICEAARDSGLPGNSLLLLFTKAAWMTQRPIFESIRREMVGAFEDIGGLIVNGKEFFDVSGKFPIAFTIWKYLGKNADINSSRPIELIDLTWMKKKDLSCINWKNSKESGILAGNILSDIKSNAVPFGIDRINIKEWCGLTRFDFQREKRKAEKIDPNFRCGLPEGDRRHSRKKTLGEVDGKFVGFMDDLTPCRVKNGTNDNPWFYLDTRFMRVRTLRCFSGPPDNRGYVAKDTDSCKKLFLWFALGKTFASHGYPMWADADEIWPITMPRSLERKVTKICFSIGFSENECIEAIFPANNPVKGVREIVARNPMTPLDQTSFWSKNIAQYFQEGGKSKEDLLVASVTQLYKLWKKEFKQRKEIYVDYERPYFLKDAPVLTINAGILQIRDYAKESNHTTLLEASEDIQKNLKIVKNGFSRILLQEEKLNYFGLPIEFIPETLFDMALQLRLALAGTIVNGLHKDKTLGRVKLAKIFYLADQTIGKNLKMEYYREAAGPLDQRSLYHKKIGIEALANQYDYFSSYTVKTGNKKRIEYNSGPNLKNLLRQAKKLFGKDYEKIINIIELLEPLDTAQCEIVATLYACWNDLLLSKNEPNDSKIINDFKNKWHMKKKEFSERRLQKALIWMKENNIVPTGKGKRTKEKH